MIQGKAMLNKYLPTAIRVLLFCILCAVALIIFNSVTQGLKGIWSQILTALLTLIVALILTKLFSRWEKMPMKEAGIIPHRKSFSKFIIGWVIGVLLATLQPIIILATGHIKLEYATGFSSTMTATYFVWYLLLAFREEVAFRGYPMFSLYRVAGAWFAILFTGIIFIAEHKAGGMNWASAIWGAGVGSILFGIAALKTKGLALPTGLHAAWNFGQAMLGFKKEPGMLQVVIEKGYEERVDTMGWISYLLVMSFAILALYYTWKKI
ncbi:MAG: type II CAAX endopeptidase family protein [Ferruginibacter sp.]